MAYEPWSREEIDEYKVDRKLELGPMYAAAGISIDEPHRRAEYLEKQLKLGMTDEEIIRGVTKEKGRPAGLKMLETMALMNFF